MPETSSSRRYHGWNIVAAATVVTLLTVGMRMGVGPFFLPITEDLGYSRSVLAGIVAIGMLFYGLAMPVAGYLVGRIGTRAVLLIGTLIVVLSSVWSIYAREVWSFLLAYGILLSIGLGFTSPVALTPVIAKWFTRKRGMALFFLSTGSMAGIAVMTPLFTILIGAMGWKWTMIAFAALFTIIIAPLALWVINENAPADTDTRLEDKAAAAKVDQTKARAPKPSMVNLSSPLLNCSFNKAVQSRPFWQVFIGLFACGFSMNLLGTHGVPMLMDHGFDAMTASGGIGMIGLVAIFSTVMLGRLADRMPRRVLLAIIYFVRGLGFFALLVVLTPLQLYIVAAIGGIVWAGSIALSSAILADVYGVRLVGILYGWAYLGHQVGAMISSWFGGWGYEAFGSHWPAFGASGILLFVAAAISMQLPGRALRPAMAA
ncbi:MFS transporter [Orrella marina]|nr:MFS transporter [Orrella marina]